MTSKEVAKYEPLAMIQTSLQTALAPIKEALGPGEALSVTMLEQAKVPTGGGLTWQLSDGGAVREIEGVIILRQPTRVYWAQSFDESGGSTPPDCSSLDFVTGQGDPGGACGNCSLRYGASRDEEGERCSDRTRIFLLQDGNILPILLNLPATSFRNAQGYALRLAGKGAYYYQFVTKLGLEKAQSQGGIPYAKASFATVRQLDADEQRWVDNYRTEIIPYLNSLSVVDVEAGA
jgi:hypothetical protein